MGKVYNQLSTNKIILEDNDGRIVWATDRRPINLLPQANWITKSNHEIWFDNFQTFVNYAHQRVGASGGSGWETTIGDTCQTVTMIVPEERTYDGQILGTVPNGVNYIDVRVKLVRTRHPMNYLDQWVPSLIAENQWVHLPGGSGLLEATGIWRRLFEIVLEGQNVVFRRKQSVAPVPPDAVQRYGGIYNTVGNGLAPDRQTTYAAWGWVPEQGQGFAQTQRPGHPAALIESKEFSANNGASAPTMGAKHPRRERACMVSNTIHDFSSLYIAELEIRPGYMPS